MWRSSSFAVLAVSVVAACSPQKQEAAAVADTAAPAPVPAPAATPIAAGHVAVKLTCLADGGVEFSLSPWKVEAADGNFTWDNDPNSTVDVDIKAAGGQGTPPFGGIVHKALRGQPLHVTPISSTPKNKIFKYMVAATCTNPDRKVIIDPDMIIPTLKVPGQPQ